MTPEPFWQPPGAQGGDWTLVARNRRVNKSWRELCERAPADAVRWYEILSQAPMIKIPRRLFPMRFKQYKGAWECRVNAGDRILFVPDPTNRVVDIYYAGPHPPSPYPTP